MNIVIIDYGAGNIKSIQFAIQRLGYEATLSNNVNVIRNADKVIFPGVGEASSAMKKLREREIDQLIPSLTQPVLGICLGMQLMCSSSAEGNTTGLGIFDIDVIKFTDENKVPHMGWNTITKLESDLFLSIPEAGYMYSVHSFYTPMNKYTVATTSYGLDYTAAMQRNNFYGVQFHPEKSGSTGAQLLKNFLEL
jgi:glutamine amidotransferase